MAPTTTADIRRVQAAPNTNVMRRAQFPQYRVERDPHGHCGRTDGGDIPGREAELTEKPLADDGLGDLLADHEGGGGKAGEDADPQEDPAECAEDQAGDQNGSDDGRGEEVGELRQSRDVLGAAEQVDGIPIQLQRAVATGHGQTEERRRQQADHCDDREFGARHEHQRYAANGRSCPRLGRTGEAQNGVPVTRALVAAGPERPRH